MYKSSPLLGNSVLNNLLALCRVFKDMPYGLGNVLEGLLKPIRLILGLDAHSSNVGHLADEDNLDPARE